ncbi:hypothetical protein AX16_005381 [Volvariella volvacea WC 439]|nr:hypothetical protein AX16_005381 [Volvariella volvacea WC 439]
MGFFSSRRSIDNDYFITTAAATAAESPGGNTGDRGVVKVIRSRFYGKNKDKGKEREHAPPPTSYKPHALSAAEALSIPQPQPTVTPRRSATFIPSAHNSPAVGASPTSPGPGPTKLRNTHLRTEEHERNSRLTTPNRKSNKHLPMLNTNFATAGPSGSALARHGTATEATPSSSPASRKKIADATPVSTPIRSTATDNITATLAQRLNELATANAEGLLTDDEYRLLRQNLFERFSTTTTVPTEAPIVPVARPRPRVNGSSPDGRPSSVVRPLSVNLTRSPSIQSKSSRTSGVSNLIRRGTKRSISTNDISDASSMVSNGSASKKLFSFSRVLTKKSSDSSVKTAASRQADNVSVTSSKRTGSNADPMSPFSSGTGRSAAGSRKYQSPPSSFPMRAIGAEPRFAGSQSNIFDDDHLQTSQDIKEEIAAVEAEARRLMDAFHGLELTTMTKIQRRQALSAGEDDSVESTWTLIPPDGQSARRLPIHGDSDAASTRSGASAGTAPSMARSAHSASVRKVVIRSKSNLTTGSLAVSHGSKPSSLHRKNSISSVTSQERKHMLKNSVPPPVPAIPAAYGHLAAHNASSVSLARSNGHLPLAAGVEDDKSSVGNSPLRRIETGKQGAESEIEEIRRRRDEVNSRYEARLEYLRAKLKGAQLHEKLLKK